VAIENQGGGERIVACAALELVWRDLAEIKSLAVADEMRGHGIGTKLVKAAIDEARRLKLARVFALTREARFFEKLGFRDVPKETLPHKVWTDCIQCPMQTNCDEVAMVIDLAP
jgi:amino-acid N-acetyltransferase